MLMLNCDLGESYGSWKMGNDEAVMPHIDQANIACGFHGGDPLVMKNTLALAQQHNVMVGAHPAYPDLVGFGRRPMQCSADEISAFVQELGATIVHLPREDGFAPGYYSVLFEDPDGIRIEVNHVPGRGHLKS